VDCGSKNGILRALLARDVTVTVVPWHWPADREGADGVVVSNGPGDPRQVDATIATVRRLMDERTPILGICLGSQVLALAAGGDTHCKVPFGPRQQDQPMRAGGKSLLFYYTQESRVRRR